MAGLHVGCTEQLGPGSDLGSTQDSGGTAGELGGAAGARNAAGSTGGGTGGAGSQPGEEMPPLGPTSFSCDPGLAGASPPLRRLTKTQYTQSLHDLLAMSLDDAQAQSVMGDLAEILGQLEPETRIKVPEDLHGTYRRLDQTVQQPHVDTWFSVGRKVGELLSTPERLSALLGPCAEDAGSEEQANACLRDFVQRFGKLALRRPLSDEEVSFYLDFAAPASGIDPAAFTDVITGLLNAPQFLYVVEHGEAAVDDQPDTFALSAHELATRLALHFWNSMPDEELLALADSGDLLDEAVFAAEVERLWADARTFETITDFFREWLKLEDLPALDRNNEADVFINFAGENLPSAELRSAMIDEALALLNYYTWQNPSGLGEVFLTPHAFPESEELATLYGVEPWDGDSEPPELDDRPGLLTRAAFLSTGTANTRPIMKGVFIRTNVLCDVIPPPPENANAVPPDLDPELTTREVVEALTQGKANASCAGCHETFINPLGFATESFDSLGRTRSEQMLFDDQGSLLGTKPIDTRTVPQVIVGDTTEVAGPAELMEVIASSGKLEACFARHYFRFTFGRFEQVAADGCILEQMRSSLESTGSVADMLREVALTDAFKRRTFTPVAPTAEDNDP